MQRYYWRFQANQDRNNVALTPKTLLSEDVAYENYESQASSEKHAFVTWKKKQQKQGKF